jgi:hypothetical protein
MTKTADVSLLCGSEHQHLLMYIVDDQLSYSRDRYRRKAVCRDDQLAPACDDTGVTMDEHPLPPACKSNSILPTSFSYLVKTKTKLSIHNPRVVSIQADPLCAIDSAAASSTSHSIYPGLTTPLPVQP